MPENAKHRHAFDAYWKLGSGRTIEKLHAVLCGRGGRRAGGRPSSGHGPTAGKSAWPALRKRRRGRKTTVRVEALREMYERQAKEALLLQHRGAEWLAGITDDKVTADAAVRALVEGARLERLARGEPTDRQEVSTHDQENKRLAAITDA